MVYTDHQRLELEKEFHYSRYITIRRKAELATNLGLSERQVSRQLVTLRYSIFNIFRGRTTVTRNPLDLGGIPYPWNAVFHQTSTAVYILH